MVEIIEEPDDAPEQSQLTSLQQEGLTRTCNGCGGAPRLEEGRRVPLKRCSVCHQAWYHDRDCQQNDFPLHKKMCKRLLKNRQQRKLPQEQQNLVCRVAQETTKGRCLVANGRLTYGTVLGPKNATTVPTKKTEQTETDIEKPHNKKPDSNPHNHWEPIVSPVLLENHRRFRCAVCFGLLHDENPEALDTYYPTRLCSDACRRTAASFLPSEEQAIRNLPQKPPRMLPTAILLYRLVLAMERDTSGRTKALLSQLQSERLLQDKVSEEEEAHQQAVCATTWAMIKAIATLPLWKLEDLTALLQQVKLNGFSVCTAESVALGMGVYTAPSAAPNLVNHDCQPNLLQTFDYGVVGRFPSLRLTVCVEAIAANEELTISYIDNTMPKGLRQERLQNDYGFRCQCKACQSNTKDDALVHKELLQFQSLDDTKALSEAYQSLKQKSNVSPWYAHDCGERLLQSLLDELGGTEDAQEQYALAAQAFQLTEELLKGVVVGSPTKDATILRQTILRYKSIKLRLFLNVHPERAMDELETDILPTCNTFFPGHHELMRNLVQDLCL